MQRRRREAESVTHNYYNSFTKPKFYKNTRLAGKIIEKTSLTNCRVTNCSPHPDGNRRWAQQAQYNKFVREWAKALG